MATGRGGPTPRCWTSNNNMAVWWIPRLPVVLAVLVRTGCTCRPRREECGGRGVSLQPPFLVGLRWPRRWTASCLGGQGGRPRHSARTLASALAGAGCPSLARCPPAQGLQGREAQAGTPGPPELCPPHADQFLHFHPHPSHPRGQAACPPDAPHRLQIPVGARQGGPGRAGDTLCRRSGSDPTGWPSPH